MGSHGESSLCGRVQLRFFDPRWRLKCKFLDQACEEDEELHRGETFSDAVSPPCNAKSMAVGGEIGQVVAQPDTSSLLPGSNCVKDSTGLRNVKQHGVILSSHHH